MTIEHWEPDSANDIAEWVRGWLEAAVAILDSFLTKRDRSKQ
jgi:hypothetical protein